VIMIDDANDPFLLEKIMRFIDGLNDLRGRSPGVLLVLSMLDSTYEKVANTANLDKSLRDRICFNQRIQTPGPTVTEVTDLVKRLAQPSARAHRRLIIPNGGTEEIVKQC
jgi:hypothetical protein